MFSSTYKKNSVNGILHVRKRMNIWFWRLTYSPHHFRVQILSIVMLQASIYDSGREGEGGGGNSYSFLHRGILPGSEILIFITFSIPLSHLTFRELCTFSEWIHTPTRRSKAMQMNVLQNGWFILAEQNFSRALSTLLPPGTAAYGHGGLASTQVLEYSKLRVDPYYSMWIRSKIQLYSYISVTSPSCEMGHNRVVLKFISIAQIIMSAIFLALGMADRYEARYIYTSYLFMPCWIAALVSTLRCKVHALVPCSVLSWS